MSFQTVYSMPMVMPLHLHVGAVSVVVNDTGKVHG